MRYFMAIVCGAAGLAFLGPVWKLIGIAWKDRALTSKHPDYAWVWGGKKIIYVGMAFFFVVSLAFFWSALQWIVMRR